jgi:glycosyltransferase
MNLKVSIVTAVYNRVSTVADAIESVKGQSYKNIEYVTIDGMSTDGTDEVIKQYGPAVDISIREKDEGIYDALNKGINVASGDIVGFLHADDVLATPDVIQKIADCFSENECDAVYGDLVYVDAKNPSRIVRYWRSGEYGRKRFYRGWMPPHPTFYVRRQIYDQLGGYLTDIGSAADYECLIRLMVKHRIKVKYLPAIIVKMRTGGASNATLTSRLNANNSDRLSWMRNGLTPPLGLRITKPLSKLPQYFLRPRS